MITHRFWLGVAALLYVIGALYVVGQITEQGLGFFTSLKILLILAPLFIMLMNVAEPIWISFALGTALLSGVALPIPLFDRLSIGISIGSVIAVLVFAGLAINKKYPSGIFERGEFKWLLIFCAIVWTRLLMDRPGSARLGGAGGLGEALPMALSGIVFMALAVAAQRHWPPKANLLILLLLGTYEIIVQTIGVFVYFLSGMHARAPNCFNPVTWTELAFLLGLAWMWSQQAGRKSFLAYWSAPFCAAATLAFGLLSAQRSRPYYALVMILVMAYVMKSFKRATVLVVLLALPVFFAVALKPALLPGAALRTLSTLAPGAVKQELISRQMTDDIAQGEMGWENEWRSTLTRMAWEDVKRHPFTGRGFAFGLGEMLSALRAGGGAMEGMILGLALSGGYHNGLLTIAAFCGIPAALAFLVGSLWIFLRFVRQVRQMDNSDFWGKAFAVGLAASFLPNFWQMAINGSGPQIFTCMVYCGVMYGLSYRFSKQAGLGPAVVSQRVPPGRLAGNRLALAQHGTPR
jgi:hypothetical protein